MFFFSPLVQVSSLNEGSHDGEPERPFRRRKSEKVEWIRKYLERHKGGALHVDDFSPPRVASLDQLPDRLVRLSQGGATLFFKKDTELR